MKPTRADLMFYRMKTTPKWAQSLKDYQHVTIDDVINSHAPKDKRDPDFEYNNTYNIIISRRRRGEDLRLSELAEHPQCIHPQRRSAIAKRLIRKISSAKEVAQ